MLKSVTIVEGLDSTGKGHLINEIIKYRQDKGEKVIRLNVSNNEDLLSQEKELKDLLKMEDELIEGLRFIKEEKIINNLKIISDYNKEFFNDLSKPNEISDDAYREIVKAQSEILSVKTDIYLHYLKSIILLEEDIHLVVDRSPFSTIVYTGYQVIGITYTLNKERNFLAIGNNLLFKSILHFLTNTHPVESDEEKYPLHFFYIKSDKEKRIEMMKNRENSVDSNDYDKWSIKNHDLLSERYESILNTLKEVREKRNNESQGREFNLRIIDNYLNKEHNIEDYYS